MSVIAEPLAIDDVLSVSAALGTNSLAPWLFPSNAYLPAVQGEGYSMLDYAGGHHLTLTNMEQADWIPNDEDPGYALSFDGFNEYAIGDASTGDIGTGPFSLVWRQENTASGIGYPICKGTYNSNPGWATKDHDGNGQLWMYIGGSSAYTTLSNVNQWSTYCLSRDDQDVMHVYKDGEEASWTADNISGNTKNGTSSQVFTIGCRSSGGTPSSYYKMDFSGAYLYYKALTPEDQWLLAQDFWLPFRRSWTPDTKTAYYYYMIMAGN